MNKTLAQQLETLEINQAYQEETIEKLESLLLDQQKQLDHLHRQIKTLTAQQKNGLDSTGGNAGFDPANEIPPHY